MCLSLKCLSYISFLLTIQWEYIDSLNIDNDSIWTIHSMLDMEIWRNGTLAVQKFLINGQPTTFKTIVDENTTDETIGKITSAMYMTLECSFTENLMNILNKTLSSAEKPFENINEIVLKMISIILDLIDLAPNVMSHEPGFLTTLLSLNCLLNEAINFILIQNENSKNTDQFDVDQFDLDINKKIFTMINLLDRLKIPNCILNDSIENEYAMMTDNKSRKVDDYFSLIGNLNTTLDKVGLFTTIVSEIQTHDMSKKNYNFNTIVIQIIRQLDFILNIDESLIEKVKFIGNDAADIITYMDLIFDSLMQIAYNKTIASLKLIKKCQTNKNSEKIQIIRNKWVQNDVINIYEELILKSYHMRFPMYFINHIKFVLEMVKDIIYRKEIRDIKILITKINASLEVLQNKIRPNLELLPINNERNYTLWEILSKIVSIQKFKYFNLIIESQQNYGPGEYGSIEMALNKMKENKGSPASCQIIQLMYGNVFFIMEKVKIFESKSSSVDNLKKEFENFLSIIRNVDPSILKFKVNTNLRLILPMLNTFLNYNLMNFSDDATKLKRILHFTLNLLDKYQIHSCMYLQLRGISLNMYNQNQFVYEPNIQLHKSSDSNAQNKAMISESSFIDDDDSHNYEEELSLNLLKNSYINSLKPEQQTPLFYWKGELQTFNDIYENVKNDSVIDFTLFRKYIDVFHKWVISLLLHTMIDYFQFSTIIPQVFKNSNTLIAFVRKLKQIKFPTYVLPVIKTISKAENLYNSYPINLYQSFIEDHVLQYTVNEEKDESYFSSKEFDFFHQQLNKYYVKLIKIFNNVKII